LDTIVNLSRLVDVLESRGYDEEGVDRILRGNWLRLLEDI
jgi:microsomal dipeptidase-like Zn-dependent dipeptidase